MVVKEAQVNYESFNHPGKEIKFMKNLDESTFFIKMYHCVYVKENYNISKVYIFMEKLYKNLENSIHEFMKKSP